MGSVIKKSVINKNTQSDDNETTVEIEYTGHLFNYHDYYVIINNDENYNDKYNKLNEDMRKCPKCHKFADSKPDKYYNDLSYKTDLLHEISNDFFMTNYETSFCGCLCEGEIKESLLNLYSEIYIKIYVGEHKRQSGSRFNDNTKKFDLIEGIDEFNICSLTILQ